MKILTALCWFAFAAQPLHSAELYTLTGKVLTETELRVKGYIRVSGKVLQTIKQGALVMTDGDNTLEKYQTVLVNRISGRADGDPVFVMAAPGELFEYLTVLGAKKTVRSYQPAAFAAKWQVEAYEKEEAEKDDRLAKSVEKAKEFARTQAKVEADFKQFAADAKTFAFFLKRAESGDVESQHEVALRLLVGKGVERDEAKARDWLAKAAAQGHAKAKARLAETNGK